MGQSFSASRSEWNCENRKKLDQHIKQYKSEYSSLVREVNIILNNCEVPLADGNLVTLTHNATGVESGNLVPEQAHMREVKSFFKQGLTYLQKGDAKNAAANMFGSCINILAATMAHVPRRESQANPSGPLPGDFMRPH